MLELDAWYGVRVGLHPTLGSWKHEWGSQAWFLSLLPLGKESVAVLFLVVQNFRT